MSHLVLLVEEAVGARTVSAGHRRLGPPPGRQGRILRSGISLGLSSSSRLFSASRVALSMLRRYSDFKVGILLIGNLYASLS